MLPCNHGVHYAISVSDTYRPKLLTTYKTGPFMASIAKALIDSFPLIDMQLPVSCVVNIKENVNMCNVIITCDKIGSQQ